MRIRWSAGLVLPSPSAKGISGNDAGPTPAAGLASAREA